MKQPTPLTQSEILAHEAIYKKHKEYQGERRRHLLDVINDATVTVSRIPLDRLMAETIERQNRRNEEHDNPQRVSSADSPQFLRRICVNHIRHELTTIVTKAGDEHYQHEIDKAFRGIRSNEEYLMLYTKVTDAIILAYPEFKRDIIDQANNKLKGAIRNFARPIVEPPKSTEIPAPKLNGAVIHDTAPKLTLIEPDEFGKRGRRRLQYQGGVGQLVIDTLKERGTTTRDELSEVLEANNYKKTSLPSALSVIHKSGWFREQKGVLYYKEGTPLKNKAISP